MRRPILTSGLVSLICCLLFTGCGDSGTTTPSFTLHTFRIIAGQQYNDGFVYTDGFCCVNDPQHTLYDPSHLSYAQTDATGRRAATGKYTNVFWSFTRYATSNCGVITKGPIFVPERTNDVPLPCDSTPFFNASPNSFDVTSPPSTITFSGDALLDTTYDLPIVDFYDDAGNWLGYTQASSVTNDGTSLTISTPSFLTSQYSGSYIAVISNFNEDYSTTAVAVANVDLYGNDPPPPQECDCAMTCEEYNQAVANCQAAGGTWLSWSCICQGP